MSGLSDAELFAPEPHPGAKPAAPAAAGGDPAIWTVLGEAGADREGQRAVASTIVNRARQSGVDPSALVADRGQGYEAWNSHAAELRQKYPPGSEAYEAARRNVWGFLHGGEPAPYDYTHFYGPAAQRQLGRQAPAWDDGTGVNVGGNLFFTHPAAASAGLSDSDKSEWDALHVRLSPSADVPKPGPATDAQSDTFRFMNAHGLVDSGAPSGTSQNPTYAPPDGKEYRDGIWYVDHAGALRQSGQEGDFLPYFKNLVSRQDQAKAQPFADKILPDVGQGALDVAASMNKLAGGALGTGLPASFQAPPASPTQEGDLRRLSLEGADQRRNAWDALHGPDLAAQGLRMGGQMAASAPLLAAGGGAADALGGAVAGAAPRLGGALEFMGGRAGGNLAMQAASKAAAGAPQGAEVAALTSSTSDRPVGEQIGQGALFGAGAGAAGPLTEGAFDALGARVAGPVLPDSIRDLAQIARDKYGIPLRGTQIRGAVDRKVNTRDSEMIGQPLTGYAQNHADQRTAFTRAIAKTFGSDAEALTPDTMQAARDRIGSVFDRVGSSTHITDTDPLLTGLGAVVHGASQVIPEGDLGPLLRQVENIGSTIGPDGLSGDSYLALTRKGAPLDRLRNSADPNLRHYAGEIRSTLDDALEAHADPQVLDDLRQARLHYKNMMTVSDLAAKAGVTGEISPLLLRGAVNRSFQDRAFRGAGDLGELSDIGQAFMKEPPNSGTPARLMDALKRNGVGLGLGGSALGFGTLLHDPDSALKFGLAAGALTAGRYAGNAVSGALGNNPVSTSLLLRRGESVGPVRNALHGVTARLGDIVGPAYVPGSALAGLDFARMPDSGSAP